MTIQRLTKQGTATLGHKLMRLLQRQRDTGGQAPAAGDAADAAPATRSGQTDAGKASTLTWDDDLALAFLDWLRLPLRAGTLPVNEHDALVHIVEDGVLVRSPVAFQRFCVAHGLGKAHWKRVQARVLRRRWHRHLDGRDTPMQEYQVLGKHRYTAVHGLVFPVKRFYRKAALDAVPAPNPALHRVRS